MIGSDMGYIDMAEHDHSTDGPEGRDGEDGKGDKTDAVNRVVDVVLSDMSEPWPQTEGFWKNYLTEAYFRMMNVSGIRVKDHGDSMVRPLSSLQNSAFTIPLYVFVSLLSYSWPCAVLVFL